MYISGKINNEPYTLKEMLEHSDRKYFENAIHEEVKAMLSNKIWEKVSKKFMYSYYNDLRRLGKYVKIQHIMMIW